MAIAEAKLISSDLQIDLGQKSMQKTFIEEDENSDRKKVLTTEEAKMWGEKLGIDWTRFDVEQFRMGMNVELEHGLVSPHTNVSNSDPLVTARIALAYLNEFPDYYTRLERLEKEADAFWKVNDIRA